MSSIYENYIAEWETLHPDWVIRRWDETNSPMDLPYLQNALAQKKWANMSNLVRFHALLNEGGVYLDTDMKVIKPMDDLLTNECFLGFEEGESNGSDLWVNNAVIGAKKNNPFIRDCYEGLLEKFDGSEDANLSAPRLVTDLLKEKCGLSKYGYQILEGVTLYPQSYFYPVHYNELYKLENLSENIDESTVAVHMWGRSWLTPAQLLKMLDDLRYDYNIQVDKNHRYQAAWHSLKSAGDAFLFGEDRVDLLNEAANHQAIGNEAGVSDNNTIEDVQTNDGHFPAKALKELRGANALLKQNFGTIKDQISGSEISIKQLAVGFSKIEAGLQAQIQLLTEHKNVLQQSIDENAARLQQTLASLKGVMESRDRLAEEKEALLVALSQKEQQLNKAFSEVEALHEERAQLVAKVQESEEELQKEQNARMEAQNNLAALESKYKEYRLIQEHNNAELIVLLQNKRDAHHRDVKWYQATYENRNLFGIVKDKFLKSLFILRK